MTSYFFWGKEEFNIEAQVSELKKKFVNPEFQAMSYKIYNNPSVPALIEAISTQPFMFGSMLVLINCEKLFLSAKSEASDNELKSLSNALENLNENVHVVLSCKIPRDENKKVDTRKKLYKTISKCAKVVEFPEYKNYDKELPNWIKKQSKEKDINLSDSTIKALIDNVGVNLRNLDGELEKLKLFKHPKKEITPEDIKTVCTQTQDVFKLIDLYIEGKKDLAVDELRKLSERQHYLMTLATLNTNLRSSIAIKIDSKTMSPFEISQKIKLHEYVVKLRLEKLRSISLDALINLKQNLTKAEKQIKTGEIANPMLALELAMLN